MNSLFDTDFSILGGFGEAEAEVPKKKTHSKTKHQPGWGVLYTVSEETRIKISLANKGKKRPKISLANKGKKRPKISLAHKGKKRPKISLANKGKKKPEGFGDKVGKRRSKPIMTPNGLFPSRNAAAAAFGVTDVTIGNWLKKWPENYYYVKKEA